MIAFEVRRSPDSPDRRIAQACRTSASAVKAVRERIDLKTEAVPWR